MPYGVRRPQRGRRRAAHWRRGRPAAGLVVHPNLPAAPERQRSTARPCSSPNRGNVTAAASRASTVLLAPTSHVPAHACRPRANSIMSRAIMSLIRIECHEFAAVQPSDQRPDRNGGPTGGREICRRTVGAAQRRPDAAARQGPLYRRCQPARPGLCGDGAQPDRPWRHPRHRHRGRAQDAGRARRLYRRRSARATARSNASCRSTIATARR